MHKRIQVEEGSENIFADIGLPNPEERLAKAGLAIRISEAIRARQLTQTQAARYSKSISRKSPAFCAASFPTSRPSSSYTFRRYLAARFESTIKPAITPAGTPPPGCCDPVLPLFFEAPPVDPHCVLFYELIHRKDCPLSAFQSLLHLRHIGIQNCWIPKQPFCR